MIPHAPTFVRAPATFAGPLFAKVDTVSAAGLARSGGFRPRERPLLVKGALAEWPASKNWTFEHLAGLRNKDGSEVVTSFQNGLVEQGRTASPLIQPIAPYLRALAQEPKRDVDALGLRPRTQGTSSEAFRLDWDYFHRFEPRRAYLAQWDILKAFPELRRDFAIRALWPGRRWTWEYTFIGPADTVTGLHYDFPNNWFCMVSGTKEFLMFDPSQTPHLAKSRKYDWGATLSDIDITRIDRDPLLAESFSKAHGLYARVESGDALFVPRRTWHAVVSLEPSISLAVFGLTVPEILAGGVPSEARSLLHKLGLYRRGNCTCHGARA